MHDFAGFLLEENSIHESRDRYIYLLYIPVIFLAQIQASHASEIQHDGKKSVSTHSEIRFQIWYDDVSSELLSKFYFYTT